MELVEILKQNIARVMSDESSTSHEDPDQKLTTRGPVFVKEENVNSLLLSIVPFILMRRLTIGARRTACWCARIASFSVSTGATQPLKGRR